GSHQGGVEGARQRRVIEPDGEEVAALLAGALPRGTQLDRAGSAFDHHAIVRAFVALVLDRAEENLLPQKRERLDLAGVCAAGLIVFESADNQGLVLLCCEAATSGPR